MFEHLDIPENLYPADPRFGVGPSLIKQSALDALCKEGVNLLGTSHRRPKVRALCKEIQDGIKSYFNLPVGYEVIMGNGGATFLFDMIGLGLVKKSSMHFVSGEFSNKWYQSHKNISWLNVEKREVDFGQGNEPEFIEGHDLICCTLNETSTGVQINSVPNVPSDVLLAVDATSGAGQIPIDFKKVDLYFFSPQKVFAGEGGFYFAIMSPKAIDRAKQLQNTEHYRPQVMRWDFAIENSLKNQTYNTPSISSLFLFNEQLQNMLKRGEKNIIKESKAKLDMFKRWIDSKDYLSFFVKEEKFRSLSVITIDVDEKYNVESLCQRLRELKIVEDIEPYRKLGRNQFRIGLFDNISIQDLEKLTQIISYAIENEEA